MFSQLQTPEPRGTEDGESLYPHSRIWNPLLKRPVKAGVRGHMNMSPLACSLLGAGFPAILHISHLTRITGESEQTIRNRLSQKNYPIPSSIVGGRRIFCLGDVASYIENIQLQTNQKNIRRGRPTKAKAMLMAKQDAVAQLNIED